jgi:lipoate-protein ligase B
MISSKMRMTMNQRICRVEFLGKVRYQQAWDYQNQLAKAIANGDREETLLVLEHPHTFTIGRRGSLENLVWSEEELIERDVDLLHVDRGGDITYHGPGQLVGYPLLRLAPIGWEGDRLPQADYVGYIRKLEAVLICALKGFKIEGTRIPGKTGVWVRERQNERILKIASIGVKVDAKGITRHGFALNVHPQMAYWEGIIPCGLTDVVMTSMSAYDSVLQRIDQVSQTVIDCFGCVLERRMVVDQSGGS